MKKNLIRSNSTKNKTSIAAITSLENKLFSKLQTLQSDRISKYQDLDTKLLNSTPDALTDLIERAKGITVVNQDKIKKAKQRQLKISRKQGMGTFLTGTGLYAVQHQQEQQKTPRQPEINYDPQEMLKNLTKKNEQDDLAELRRMIRITDENLGGYSKQVHQIKNQVLNAATQFKTQMNFDLSYKLNRLQAPMGKKSQSAVKIKAPYYH